MFYQDKENYAYNHRGCDTHITTFTDKTRDDKTKEGYKLDYF